MLRYVVGDEVFWGILRKLVAVHGGGDRIDPQILQEVSEEISGEDLDWFFTQWLDRTGAPR
ncbi:MAG: M1 family peptidase, partial [Candidatus Latescibacteria bacterium]|nr:M1 family peptidase [Candidatus Latescibacterota bacterium]